MNSLNKSRFFWKQVQDFPVERSNHPIHGYGFAGLLEPGDFRAAYASVAALQLDEPKVQGVGVCLADEENDRVNNASTGRSGSAFKERRAPLVLLAVRAQSFLAGRFSRAGFDECAHTLLGCYRLTGTCAEHSSAGGLLAWGEVGRWHQHSISSGMPSFSQCARPLRAGWIGAILGSPRRNV